MLFTYIFEHNDELLTGIFCSVSVGIILALFLSLIEFYLHCMLRRQRRKYLKEAAKRAADSKTPKP